MRILHCCLAAFYIDNFGYQENILPKMHKLQGHEVFILASTETYTNNHTLGYTKPERYLNEYGIPVKRIPYLTWIPLSLAKKIRIYKGVGAVIRQFQPDIIFIHDCQFISIKEIASYAQTNHVTVYVDSHTDFINSAKSWVSRNILHKIIYRWCAKKIEPFTKKFYGTLPMRMDFYQKVYGIEKSKLALLPFGADHTGLDLYNRSNIRKEIRKKLGIAAADFVLITGGKIDERKKIHILLEVISELSNEQIHLLYFGNPTEDMRPVIRQYANHKNIHALGWLKPSEIYDYLFASDLGVYPGTHSTLWEQTLGVGLPCIFKRWYGIDHLDVGGNCIFLDSSTKSELKDQILRISKNEALYSKMKEAAMTNGMKAFSYYEIAKKAIETHD